MAMYTNWIGTKKWEDRTRKFQKRLSSCDLCPRQCHVNRNDGEKGLCRAGLLPKVASWNAHHGEEPPISGFRGSGTIFFSNCTMQCVYCQNYSISQFGEGKEVTFKQLGEYYLQLQKMGCHNVNFVTPTHYLPQIIEALDYAAKRGFHLPLVYNTSGYERKEVIADLEGIIDIYLSDIRYSSSDYAEKYSSAGDYVSYNRESLKEMYRQVGVLQCDSTGIAFRGVAIRHLVLPEHISESRKAMNFIARELSKEVYISFMKQYFPAYRAKEYPPLNRKITSREFRDAAKWLDVYNLSRGWLQ